MALSKEDIDIIEVKKYIGDFVKQVYEILRVEFQPLYELYEKADIKSDSRIIGHKKKETGRGYADKC